MTAAWTATNLIRSNKRKVSMNKFDELTQAMAQSVTRRGALKQFSLGLAGMALACFGLASRAEAGPKGSACSCTSDADCNGNSYCAEGICLPSWCGATSCCCVSKGKRCGTARPTCDPRWASCQSFCAFQCAF